MRHSSAELAEAFRRQAAHCTQLGSPLWARATTLIEADIASGGPFRALLADWTGDLERGYLPLRLLGGLHYLALAGRAPLLAAELPSTGGRAGPGLWPAMTAALAANADDLRRGLESPPQTNEIGRSAVLLGGILESLAIAACRFTCSKQGRVPGLISAGTASPTGSDRTAGMASIPC